MLYSIGSSQPFCADEALRNDRRWGPSEIGVEMNSPKRELEEMVEAYIWTR